MSSATEVSRTGMTHETLQRLLAAQQLSCNVEWVELVLSEHGQARSFSPDFGPTNGARRHLIRF